MANYSRIFGNEDGVSPSNLLPDGDPVVMPRCFWPGCKDDAWIGLCFIHAVEIYGFVREILDRSDDKMTAEIAADIKSELTVRGLPTEPRRPPGRASDGYVYYLMLSPSTVKIGTTTKLRQRLGDLRTELQYVVAIERGGTHLERQRHREFADERFGKREDFRLSARLKQHIEGLLPQRDELIHEATTA